MWITFLQELVFPSFCLGCRQEGALLCDDCRSTLDISAYNYCLCNKNPLRLPAGQSGKCHRCQDQKLSGVYSALPYQEKELTRQLIAQFKYPPHLKQLAKPLASIIVEHLVQAGNNQQELWQNSVLAPIPMERGKQKRRGYNQAEELAKTLASAISVPLMIGNLIKTRPTVPQMKLSAAERHGNLHDAFIIRHPSELTGKKVFLIDDVYTTGATMEACARVLRKAGVKTVWGITIAREE